jgi:arylsulfatase A-like enzyme
MPSQVRARATLGPASVAALVLATAVPLLDLAIAARDELWNPQFRPFAPPWRLLLSMAALELAALAAFGVAWWCGVRPLARWRGWSDGPAASALALVLGAALMPALLDEGVALDPGELWPRAIAWALGCGALLAAVWLAARRGTAGAGRLGAGARALALALPFLLLEAYLLLAVKPSLHRMAPSAFAGAALAFLLAALLTLRWCHRPRSARAVQAALGLLAGAMLLAPALARAWRPGSMHATSIAGRSADEMAVPRVLLITVDTLRRDALSCYGSPQATPALDRLASESVQFNRASSNAPWTIPSVATILTGLTPWVHGSDYGTRKLEPLAEWMRGAGYATMRAGYNPVLSGELAARGFDEDRFAHHRPMPATAAQRVLAAAFPRLMGWKLTSEEITRAASTWITARAGQPFFAWIHYFDPHAPLAPPEGFWPEHVRAGAPGHPGEPAVSPYPQPEMPPLSSAEQEIVRELYLAEVRSVDAAIGALLEELERNGLYDDALIVFTSDHGEELYDHGGFGHGQSLFGELLDVPLLIKLPRSQARGAIDEPVALVSIVPTILELAGIPFDAGEFSGLSLVPLWSGDPAAGGGARPIFSTDLAPEYDDEMVGVIHQRKKYLRSLVTDAEQLYDLAADPEERSNAIDAHPEFAEMARQLLEQHGAEAQAQRARLGILDGDRFEDRRAQLVLESLGYL